MNQEPPTNPSLQIFLGLVALTIVDMDVEDGNHPGERFTHLLRLWEEKWRYEGSRLTPQEQKDVSVLRDMLLSRIQTSVENRDSMT